MLHSADLKVTNEVVDGLLRCPNELAVPEVRLYYTFHLPLVVGTIIRCDHAVLWK